MAEKTIVELKKLFVVISNQYQEYKEVVGQLKHVLNDRGKTIINNKLEIYTLKKDGYSGPPEDEEFFRICQTMQRKLLKTHTETYYKDFTFFEKSIEEKFKLMDTELQHLQRISILWDEKQDPIKHMSKIIKRKEMEITALKQEMYQLFKQKEQDRLQITTLEQESKPANEKILLLKQTNEKERSIRRQIFEQLRQTKAECKELDAKLKILLEENNCLHEKYQKENYLHKNTKNNLKRLQRLFHQTVKEKNCLQNKYEKEKIKCKQTKESWDKSIVDFQVQLKETVKEHKHLEKSLDKEKTEHKNTKEALDKVIAELKGLLKEIREQQRSLERSHENEKSAHKSTKEALGQVIEEQERKIRTIKEELSQTMKDLLRMSSENQLLTKSKKELQVQLQSTAKENKVLEETYQQEVNKKEDVEKSIKKLMSDAIEELEVKLKKEKENTSFLEEKYLKEVDAHQRTRDQLGQNIQELQEQNQLLREKYENGQSSHRRTDQEQLAQKSHQTKDESTKLEKVQLQLEQAVKEKESTKSNYQEEMSAHQHTKELLNHLQEVHEKEKSEHRTAKEELKQWTEKARELQLRVKEAEGKISLVKVCQKEKSDLENMTAKADELLVLLKEAMEKNKGLEMNWKQESSAHINTRKELEKVKNHNIVINDKLLQLQRVIEAKKENINLDQATEMSGLQLQLQHALEELDEAKRQKKSLEAKLEEIEQLTGNGKNYPDLQLRTRDRQFVQDLQGCLSAICDAPTLKQRIITLKKCYMDNEQMQVGELVEQVYQVENRDLKKRLHGCENLLKDKTETINRLEKKLSGIVQVCDQRESEYVQILNSHILKEQQLKKELEKASKRIPQKFSSWWQEKVLKITSEIPQEAEEQIKLYPEDWRLPDFPGDDHLLDY